MGELRGNRDDRDRVEPAAGPGGGRGRLRNGRGEILRATYDALRCGAKRMPGAGPCQLGSGLEIRQTVTAIAVTKCRNSRPDPFEVVPPRGVGMRALERPALGEAAQAERGDVHGFRAAAAFTAWTRRSIVAWSGSTQHTPMRGGSPRLLLAATRSAS